MKHDNESAGLDRKKHLCMGETVLFATKHGKEDILRPILSELEKNCVANEVDTDQFGIFTGEIERTRSVRETLRKKIYAEFLCFDPVHGEQALGPRDDFRKALVDRNP